MGKRHNLEVDLWQDSVKLARKDILRRGFKTNGLETDDDVILTCLEVQRQDIPQYPRVIAKARGFLCPPQYSGGSQQD